MKKRIFSIILALALCVGLAVPALAEGTTETINTSLTITNVISKSKGLEENVYFSKEDFVYDDVPFANITLSGSQWIIGQDQRERFGENLTWVEMWDTYRVSGSTTLTYRLLTAEEGGRSWNTYNDIKVYCDESYLSNVVREADIRFTDTTGTGLEVNTSGDNLLTDGSKIHLNGPGVYLIECDSMWSLHGWSFFMVIVEDGATPPPPPPSLSATPSQTNFIMNGNPIAVPEAYSVNDNNYLQLRAIAALLNGTQAQFDVSWDGQYGVIETGKPFSGTTTSTTMRPTTDVRPSNTSFKIDGEVVTFERAYLIDGDTNYLQLREVAELLSGTSSQFNAYWDAGTSTAVIVPGVPYTGVG